jgi:hypothetical protein
MRVLAALLLAVAIARAESPPPVQPPPVVQPPPALAPLRPAPEEPAVKPVWKRPWLWLTACGVAGVLATGIALGTIYGGPERDPEPTFRIPGN